MPDVIQTIIENAAAIPAGPAGTAAKWAMKVLKFADSQHEKSVRDKAREILGCKHIVVCPHNTFNTRQTDMIDFVLQTCGMAFVYESVALGHISSDMDVKRLSTQVIRHEFVNGKSSYTDYPKKNTMSCGHCMRERTGI